MSYGRNTSRSSPNLILWNTVKGQLISKAIYDLLTSPKKRTDEFVLFAFLLFTADKSNSFVRFLRESTAHQSAFRIYMTFICAPTFFGYIISVLARVFHQFLVEPFHNNYLGFFLCTKNNFSVFSKLIFRLTSANNNWKVLNKLLKSKIMQNTVLIMKWHDFWHCFGNVKMSLMKPEECVNTNKMIDQKM